MELIETLENTTGCFAKSKYGGCKALSYYSKDFKDDPTICDNCKFKKTHAQYNAGKRPKPSGIKKIYLIFDGQNIGLFKSIKEIDDWLINYYEDHKKTEFLPRTSVFDDYNLLFINHDIKFVF